MARRAEAGGRSSGSAAVTPGAAEGTTRLETLDPTRGFHRGDAANAEKSEDDRLLRLRSWGLRPIVAAVSAIRLQFYRIHIGLPELSRQGGQHSYDRPLQAVHNLRNPWRVLDTF